MSIIYTELGAPWDILSNESVTPFSLHIGGYLHHVGSAIQGYRALSLVTKADNAPKAQLSKASRLVLHTRNLAAQSKIMQKAPLSTVEVTHPDGESVQVELMSLPFDAEIPLEFERVEGRWQAARFPQYTMIKEQCMLEIALCKFTQNPALLMALLLTKGDCAEDMASLNAHHQGRVDSFWSNSPLQDSAFPPREAMRMVYQKLYTILVNEFDGQGVRVRHRLSKALCERIGLTPEKESEEDLLLPKDILQSYAKTKAMAHFLDSAHQNHSVLTMHLPKGYPLQSVVARLNERAYQQLNRCETVCVKADRIQAILDRLNAPESKATEEKTNLGARIHTHERVNLQAMDMMSYLNYLQNAYPDESIGVLHATDQIAPAGQYEKGVVSEDALIARASNLGAHLQHLSTQKAYYCQEEGFGNDQVLVTKNVLVTRHGRMMEPLPREQQFTTTAISVPAIDLRHPKPKDYVTQLQTRLCLGLQAAIDAGVTRLILGAFSCLRYQNEASEVARVFHEVLQYPEFAGKFASVDFCILRNPSQPLDDYAAFNCQLMLGSLCDGTTVTMANLRAEELRHLSQLHDKLLRESHRQAQWHAMPESHQVAILTVLQGYVGVLDAFRQARAPSGTQGVVKFLSSLGSYDSAKTAEILNQLCVCFSTNALSTSASLSRFNQDHPHRDYYKSQLAKADFMTGFFKALHEYEEVIGGGGSLKRAA